MPLLSGASDEIMRENVSELRRSGYPEDQAVAIALKKQRDAQKDEDDKAANPLAAAAARAKDVREGKTSAQDAANAPTVVSESVVEEGLKDAVRPRVAENDPSGQAAPKKAADKPLPKFKTRGAQSHVSRK